jgi:hypothetical protein
MYVSSFAMATSGSVSDYHWKLQLVSPPRTARWLPTLGNLEALAAVVILLGGASSAISASSCHKSQ